MKLLAAAAVVLAVVVGTASPASAHGGSVASTNYLARITGAPEVDGLDVRLVEAAGRVELTNRTGTDVIVLGYEDEPYLRITDDGVYENRRSPAVYLNARRNGGDPVPADAGPDAEPRWVRTGDGPTARWHDHRLHWMTDDPPEVRSAPDRRRQVAEWELPLRVGDREVTVRGDITYVPGPARWPWLVAAAALAVAVVVAVRRLGWWALVAAVALLVVADVARVGALTFVLVGGAGDRFRQAVDVGTLSFVGWGLAVVAVVRLLQRRPDGRMAAGLAGVLLAIVGGVLEWDDIARSQVAVAGNPDLVRLAVAVATGIGAGIAGAVLLETSRPAGRRARR